MRPHTAVLESFLSTLGPWRRFREQVRYLNTDVRRHFRCEVTSKQ